MTPSGNHWRRAFTLVELLVVIIILAVLISLLLPALSRVRSQSVMNKLAQSGPPADMQRYQAAPAQTDAGAAQRAPLPPPPLALVKAFTAKVDLTPRLSVGTAEPESIYEARFTAKLEASAPSPAPPARSGTALTDPVRECEIRLPLPPQIISLADLSVTVNGEPSDTVVMREGAGELVWTGTLPASATPVDITYSAVGKGLYTLQTPPGRIIDTFDLELTANGSDVRMLELSLQPRKLVRDSGKTVYTWEYKKLMFGRPIALDVLGIAPIDRLGELRWLGPLSVVAFGILVGLYAQANQLARFDRWMLLMILGAFTGAYPLMYFAQEFVPLNHAMLWSAALVLVILAVRAVTIIGVRHTLLGVVLPAVATMALALTAATQPQLQGILLTGFAILFFIAAMILIPRVQLTTPTPPHPTDHGDPSDPDNAGGPPLQPGVLSPES